jgi:uncharacterized protein YwbE
METNLDEKVTAHLLRDQPRGKIAQTVVLKFRAEQLEFFHGQKVSLRRLDRGGG